MARSLDPQRLGLEGSQRLLVAGDLPIQPKRLVIPHESGLELVESLFQDVAAGLLSTHVVKVPIDLLEDLRQLNPQAPGVSRYELLRRRIVSLLLQGDDLRDERRRG